MNEGFNRLHPNSRLGCSGGDFDHSGGVFERLGRSYGDGQQRDGKWDTGPRGNFDFRPDDPGRRRNSEFDGLGCICSRTEGGKGPRCARLHRRRQRKRSSLATWRAGGHRGAMAARRSSPIARRRADALVWTRLPKVGYLSKHFHWFQVHASGVSAPEAFFMSARRRRL